MTEQMKINLPKEVKMKLEKISNEESRTPSDMIAYLIDRYDEKVTKKVHDTESYMLRDWDKEILQIIKKLSTQKETIKKEEIIKKAKKKGFRLIEVKESLYRLQHTDRIQETSLDCFQLIKRDEK